jgi:hypothetical protein
MPGGPSFSDRPNYRRRRLAVLLLGLGVVALVVVLLTRGGGVLGKKEPPIPELAFAAKVTGVTQAKALDQGATDSEGESITKKADGTEAQHLPAWHLLPSEVG